MRYVTFSTAADPAPRLAIQQGDRLIEAGSLPAPGFPGGVPTTLLALVQRGPDAWQRLAALAGGPAAERARAFGLADVRWHAPIPRPAKNVFCVGRNYADHVAEGARARGEAVNLPQHTVFFSKAPTAVTGPYDTIDCDPAVTQQVDWEAELALVIGVGGRNITRAAALEHVFGYTVVNDVSARDLQKRHFQFFKGKSLDGFCPMGPWVVTADEYGSPQGRLVSCRVNGVTKQQQRTSEMIFPVDAIIEQLSHGLTLEPGDLIATGTPEGVGMGRTPPEYLQDGDVLETEVEGIGVLRNTIRSMHG